MTQFVFFKIVLKVSNVIYSERSFKQSLPWVLLIVGLLFLAADLFNVSKTEWVDLLFGRVADVLLVGGILGFLVNASRFLGLFKQDLEEIIYGKGFVGTRKDLEDVWNNLSLLIFKERFPQINKELVASIKKAYLPDEDNIYYRDYSFTVQIEWEDESNKLVKVTETLSFDVISSTKNNVPLVLDSVLIVPDKDKIGSCLSLSQFLIDGNNVLPIEKKDYDDQTNVFHYTCSYDLKGKMSYEVVCKREKHYCLYDDCDISFYARHIIHGMQVKVTYPKGMSIYSRARGTINSFKQLPTAQGLLEMKYSGIILPKQGIIFIIKS